MEVNMFKFIRNYYLAFIALCIGVILTIVLSLVVVYFERLHISAIVSQTVVKEAKYLSIHSHGLWLLLVILFGGVGITLLLFLYFYKVKKHELELMGRQFSLEELVVSQKRYKILFETNRDAIVTLSPPGWLFTAGNQAAVEMFRCKNEGHFISFAPFELSPEFQPDGKPSKDKALEMINIAMERGSHFFEWRYKKLDGDEFPATVLLTRVEIEKGKPFLQATVRDITEIKQAELEILEKNRQLLDINANLEELVAERTDKLNKSNIQLQEAHEKLKDSVTALIQAEKSSVLGTFVAGTAHELNNPLTGALNFIQYCIKHTEQDDKKYKVLQDSEREIERCITIIKNLLSFARKGTEETEDIVTEYLAAVFERVMLLLAYRVKKENIEMITNFPENLSKVPMQVNKIQQVLLNLMTNAMDALQDSETKKIIVSEEQREGMVVLTIEDTGCGVDPKHLEEIFSPFFTTKPEGVGTGLGLSIVKRIVEEHHGKINCKSQLGKGTTFTIELPL
jgi:C4-dicarboxylate-specific signal transduction histidine kinase